MEAGHGGAPGGGEDHCGAGRVTAGVAGLSVHQLVIPFFYLLTCSKNGKIWFSNTIQLISDVTLTEYTIIS